MKQLNSFIATLLLVIALAPASSLAEAGAEIELHPASSGTFTITGQLAPEVSAEFLLDTGASMVMVNRKLFKTISRYHKTISTGKVAAKMANGSTKTISTYTIPTLVLGNGCEVGPLEVAVIRGANRNLIGLNALAKLGLITLDIANEQLITTACPRSLGINPKLAAN